MDLTPGPGEDQERSEEVEASYLYLHRELDVDRTVEISGSVHVDLDMAGRVYGVERIGGVVDFDTLLSVLDVLPQKIQESAYRAGRRHEARDIETVLRQREDAAHETYARRKALGIDEQAKEWAIRARTWRQARLAAGDSDQPRTVQPQCSCPLIDTSTNSMKPEFVLGHPAGCPVHGGKYDAASAAAEKRARDGGAQTPTSGGEQ